MFGLEILVGLHAHHHAGEEDDPEDEVLECRGGRNMLADFHHKR